MSYYGILFNKKSGKISKVVQDQFGIGLLQFYGLKHCTKSKDYLICDNKGLIKRYFEGTEGCPKACRDMEGLNAETLCKGLMKALQGAK